MQILHHLELILAEVPGAAQVNFQPA